MYNSIKSNYYINLYGYDEIGLRRNLYEVVYEFLLQYLTNIVIYKYVTILV